MSLKLFAIAKNGKMLRVGDSKLDGDKVPWYFMTEPLIKIFPNKGLSVNDIVVIETATQNGGQNYITSIEKEGTSPAKKEEVKNVNTGATDAGKEVPVIPQKKAYLPKEEWIAEQKAKGLWKENTGTADKGTDVNSSIKRQAIMHAVSRAMIGMQGIITPDNMEEISERLYKKFQELVG